MSAESKKKRGEAGVAKAKANPWRINGWPADWAARRIGVHSAPPARSSGSTTMRGIVGGMLVARLGRGEFYGNISRYDLMIEHAQGRCTHPMLRDDENYLAAAE